MTSKKRKRRRIFPLHGDKSRCRQSECDLNKICPLNDRRKVWKLPLEGTQKIRCSSRRSPPEESWKNDDGRFDLLRNCNRGGANERARVLFPLAAWRRQKPGIASNVDRRANFHTHANELLKYTRAAGLAGSPQHHAE